MGYICASGKECWLCELFIGSAWAKADRIKARNKKREWVCLKWGWGLEGRLPSSPENPRDPLTTYGTQSALSISTVSGIPWWICNVLSQWVLVLISKCPVSWHAQTVVCVCTKSWKLLVLKEKVLSWFSALLGKKAKHFYNLQSGLLVSRWEMEWTAVFF